MNNHTKVLVVDDDLEVCQILQRMLSDKEFQVQITQSVADAVQAIDERLFDVYLVDFNWRMVPVAISEIGFVPKGVPLPLLSSPVVTPRLSP